MLKNLIEVAQNQIAEHQIRQAIRAHEEWTLINELTKFYYHNHPLLIGGSPLPDLDDVEFFIPQAPSDEFTPLQLVFHELGEGAVDLIVERLVMGGFIFDPTGVYRDLKKERCKPTYALPLNGVFDLQVSTVNDSLGNATYITLAPYGEAPPDRLNG